MADEDSPSPAPTPPSLTTLATLRSLIINPNTPNPLLSSLFQTLTLPSGQSTPHSPPLLLTLALVHPTFSPLVVCSLLNAPYPLSLPSLSSLRALSPASFAALDDHSFTALCWSDDSGVRKWVVDHVGLFSGVERRVIGMVLTGMSGDPFPEVRRGALEGLVRLKLLGGLGSDEDEIVKGCFWRGVELLTDVDSSVRQAAVRVTWERSKQRITALWHCKPTNVCSVCGSHEVRSLEERAWILVLLVHEIRHFLIMDCVIGYVKIDGYEDEVSEWGKMLVLDKQGEEKRIQSDLVFIQLCSMTRDMNVEVRVEAFKALENLEMVSSDLLLQSLSKRELNIIKENVTFSQSTKPILYSARNVAGALVHGLEDEFYEVRSSVCQSLRKLGTLSSAFAVEAMNYLMDMLNDDEIIVRLQALESMRRMAVHGYLFVPSAHVHMFLGCLNVNNALIRHAVRKVMEVVKLQNINFFEASVHGLIKNLETYPQDEDDIMTVLFHIGRRHCNFLICFFSEVSHEMEPKSDGNLNLDCARVAALLVLAISAPFSLKHQIGNIPATIFSYAVTRLGKISSALADVDKQMLLVYLSECSRGTNHSITELRESLKLAKGDTGHSHGLSKNGPVDEKASSAKLKMLSQSVLEPDETFATDAYRRKNSDDLLTCAKIIFNEIVGVWFLIRSGHRSEAVWSLRVYEEQLTNVATDESCGALPFAIQYVRVLNLLTKIWGHIHPSGFQQNRTFGEWEILMMELDRKVGDMRCLFTGFSNDEELHLLELVLLALLLRLCKVEICCHAIFVARKLSHVWVEVEQLLEENTVEPTVFLSELKKVLPDSPFSVDNIIAIRPLFRKVVDSFCPMQFELSRNLNWIHAELVVPNNSSENPHVFIEGLPVAILLEITLHNVPKESRLWLKMTILGKEEPQQFIFLDPELVSRGPNKVSKSTYDCSLRRTPNAPSFSLMVCLGMECMLWDGVEVAAEGRRCGGPKRELDLLCREEEVYFSSVIDKYK
ncbi:hypothetical protein MLD38_032610 [Melastoma candidum]|uniref:Uncharacterized protein n=1 Tax=Melastoma candidum TaxID=119954 RepID=A0ACB9M416_9MYRT|nr:hypothetical protein MLD38_032610 [Melastoma candidum]